MFCDLKGATRMPAFAKSRHRAVTTTLLPTSDAVPMTIRDLALMLVANFSLHGDQQTDLRVGIDRHAVARRGMEAPCPQRLQDHVVKARIVCRLGQRYDDFTRGRNSKACDGDGFHHLVAHVVGNSGRRRIGWFGTAAARAKAASRARACTGSGAVARACARSISDTTLTSADSFA